LRGESCIELWRHSIQLPYPYVTGQGSIEVIQREAVNPCSIEVNHLSACVDASIRSTRAREIYVFRD
jgi:hypothetical protein